MTRQKKRQISPEYIKVDKLLEDAASTILRLALYIEGAEKQADRELEQ
jgi:hypothetical protein